MKSNNTADKVLQLTVELVETKKLKKDSNKGFNEEIKRIQKEIEDLLTENETNKETNTAVVSNK